MPRHGGAPRSQPEGLGFFGALFPSPAVTRAPERTAARGGEVGLPGSLMIKCHNEKVPGLALLQAQQPG